MGWSEPEPVGDRGFETSYRSTKFVARLTFDCHHEPRRLEVRLPADDFPGALLDHLRPFAVPFIVAEGQLAILDRHGYFRINLVPGRLQALLRKQAPPTVVAELIAQLEATYTQSGMQPADCQYGALSRTADRLQVDDARCTHCLDCVRPRLRADHLPPSQPAQDAPRPVQATAPEETA